MTWIRIDDRFTRHPKLLALTPAQRWTWLDLLCWASQFGDVSGEISAHADHAVAGLGKLRPKLRELGLLDVTENGSDAIHDWFLYAHISVEEKVEWYLRNHPDAGANEVVRQIGGNRNAVLGAVRRHHEKHAETGTTTGIEPGTTDTSKAVSQVVPNLVYETIREGSTKDASENPTSVGSSSAPAAPKPARQRDYVWDAVAEVFGPISNPKERSKRNDAVQALRVSLAAHDILDYEHQLRWRRDTLEASWGKPCSPHALATNWHAAERIASFNPPPDPHRRPSAAVAKTESILGTAQRVLERFAPLTGSDHAPSRHPVIELNAGREAS